MLSVKQLLGQNELLSVVELGAMNGLAAWQPGRNQSLLMIEMQLRVGLEDQNDIEVDHMTGLDLLAVELSSSLSQF